MVSTTRSRYATAAQSALQALWPFAAPTASPAESSSAKNWWKAVCAMAIIPLAAGMHNGLFHRPTCMMHNFGGDYNIATLTEWFLKDPSLGWAIVLAFAGYQMGLRSALIRAAAAPLFMATALFSLWIWDIPFTSHYICEHFHDAKLTLPNGVPVSGKHVLELCFTMYLFLFGITAPRFFPAGATPVTTPLPARAFEVLLHKRFVKRIGSPMMAQFKATPQPRSPDIEHN